MFPLLVEESSGIRCFECPDFMELDGKYLAIGAWMHHHDECGRLQMSRYYIGDFREQRLQVENSGWFDFGGNCYAMQNGKFRILRKMDFGPVRIAFYPMKLQALPFPKVYFLPF